MGFSSKDINFNLKKIKDIEYIPKKRDYSLDFRKYVNLGISPHIFVESVMTIYLNCRKVTSCFSDQVYFESYEEILKISKEIKKDYNICLYLIDIPSPSGFFRILYFFKDIRYYQELDNIQEYINIIQHKYVNNLEYIFDDPNLIRKLGTLLGYPRCCIDFCVDIRKKGDSIEYKTLEKIYNLYNKDSKLKSGKLHFKFDPIGYFSFEFYPCPPNCKEAKRIGKEIVEEFNKVDKKLAYSFELIFSLNINRILNPEMDIEQSQLLRIDLDKQIYELFIKDK